jgi:KipI family sensor histidine kinase inhibitor
MIRRRPYGPEAWLIDELDDPAGWAAALDALGVVGVCEVVPAASTVVVRCAREQHARVGDLLDGVEVVTATEAGDDPDLVIDVVYDGDDLADVADRCGVSVTDVIDLHVEGSYHVAFCGFSPGFGYLRGVDERLHVPRRSSPRISVPAGAVGLAAGFTCVYPDASPGGWHLIGRTDQAVWDLSRDPPAELRPGRRVRFRRADR